VISNPETQKKTLSFAKELYPKEAVLKASYCFIDRCYIYLNQTDTDYTIEVTAKASFNIEGLQHEFKNELLAQTVRHHVYKQTHTIRELLMARAMASTIIDEHPDRATEAEDTNLDEIIIDWFDRDGH